MHSGWCQLAVFVNSKPKPVGDIMREEKRSKEKRRWIKFKLNFIVLLGLIFVNLQCRAVNPKKVVNCERHIHVP
jgi:hypothetical protein